MRKGRLLICGLGIALLALVGSRATTASAHALLLRSQPNSGAVVPVEPPRLHLWFSENLNSSLSKVIVWNRQHSQVDLKDDRITHNRELTVSLKPNLPDGTYLVLWTSVSSQDGHVLKGAYLFSIGHRGPAPPAPSLNGSGSLSFPPGREQSIQILARGLELLTSALWLGLTLFLTCVIPCTTGNEETISFAGTAWARATRLLPLTLALLFLSRIVEIVIQANSLTGSWSTTFTVTAFRGLLLTTEYGNLWIAMQALVVVAFVLCWLPSLKRPLNAGGNVEASQTAISASGRGPIGPETKGRSTRFPQYAPSVFSVQGLLLLLGLAASYVLAASGHAATVDLSRTGTGLLTVPVLIDWIHVVATGIWAGGIVTVGLVLVSARRSSSRPLLWPFLTTLDRFSPFAYASVFALAATGGFNAKVHVPSWSAFFGAVYGRVLIAKIMLVLLMILISAFTVGIIRPRLKRNLRSSQASATLKASTEFMRSVLERWLRISGVLAAGVFLATALLNTYPVPLTFGAPSGPFTIQGRSGDLSMSLELTPGKAGPNRFLVRVRKNGNLVRLADVRIIETMLDMNMGTQFVVLSQHGPGTFLGAGQVAMGGDWQFEILVRLPAQSKVETLILKTKVGA